MDQIPSNWPALMLLVFALGLKHGMDADHLATIDGLTRFNSLARPRLARWCGFLFSLGHGGVVVVIALAVSAMTWRVPGWIEDVGAWISIGFLTLLGLMNLVAVFSTQPGEVVRTAGLRGRFFRRLQHTSNPLVIGLVGAFFAVSFDTMSQAALFALTGSQFGGAGHAALLGLLFMLGMTVTDGINGMWISRLMRRTDQVAIVASRVMGLVVAGLSLLVAFFGACKYFSPAVDAWSEGKELALGAGLIGVVAVSFVVALRLARPVAAKPFP